MGKIRNNDKYLIRIQRELSDLFNNIDVRFTPLLRDLKHSFSKMPGEVSKAYQHLIELQERLHHKKITLIQISQVNNKMVYLPVTLKEIEGDFIKVDHELEMARQKFSENSLLQKVVTLFHDLTSNIHRSMSKIINESFNLVKKSSYIESKERFLGTKAKG